MGARIEDPVIYMGRDPSHHFVAANPKYPGAVRYVRGDLVDKLAESLSALVGLAEMRGGHLHEYAAAVADARANLEAAGAQP